jgi:hypothetical protein
MIQLRCGPRFPDEPGASGGVVEARGRQDLDRHIPFEPLVVGAIHLAHAAGPESLDDAVRAEGSANH